MIRVARSWHRLQSARKLPIPPDKLNDASPLLTGPSMRYIGAMNEASSQPLTVMLDARYLDGTVKGIGRYTDQLVRHLLAADPSLNLELITHPACPRPIDHPRVHSQVFSAPPTSLATRFRLPQTVDFHGVHLFHSPFGLLPDELPVPAVATLHDLMWVVDTGLFTQKWWKRLITGTYYRATVARSVRQAAKILTVSEFSRQAIADHYPDVALRTAVTYNGLDPFFHPMAPAQAWPLINKWLPPRSRFVLAVGQGSPYKNHAAVVRGFLQAFGDDPTAYLVLVRRPKRGSSDEELQSLLADPRLNSRLIHLPRVSGEELKALYSLATVFLFPSLYEGFGLPILEAMACGTAVITSDHGAMAEVGGDAALLVDPRQPAQIGKALRRLFDDDDLRQRYEAQGLARAADFSWKTCAEQTLTAYRDVLRA